ncbi:MAG: DUF1080 domain-containing protein [Bacteroidota bacterium]
MTTPRFLIACSLLLLLPVTLQAQSTGIPDAFNGKDFAGWIVPENNIWWSVQDGVLQATSDPEQSGSVLWTELSYSNFMMQFEFKMGQGVIDSGIFMRNEHDQIQIGESGSLKRDMTASPYIPGKGYPVEAEGVKELLKPADWNAMTIVAIGNNYSVWLNDRKVMSYESETAIEEGPIGIQLHANRDMEISYRNIAVASLD